MALAGDLAANTLYFALVGAGPHEGALARVGAMGSLAGLGAMTMPPVIGLGRRPRGVTAAMALGWYVAGGLAAGTAFRLLRTPGPGRSI